MGTLSVCEKSGAQGKFSAFRESFAAVSQVV